MSGPSAPAPASSRWCGCSMVSCFGGCLLGLGAAAAVPTALLVVAWYFGPAWFESALAPASSAAAPAVQRPPDRAALGRFEAKVQAFGAAARGEGPSDVTLTLTQDELNAWLAQHVATVSGAGGGTHEVPVTRAEVRLEEGRVVAYATIRGDEVARRLPEGVAGGYVKGLLERVKLVDVDATVRASVRDGKMVLVAEAAHVGRLPLPVSLAQEAIDRAAAAGPPALEGVAVVDLRIAPGSLLVHGRRGGGLTGPAPGTNN